MRAVLADALGTVPIAAVERIADFAEADEPGAALRLIARLLRSRSESEQPPRDDLALLIHRMSGIQWRMSPKLLMLFRDWVSRPSIHAIMPSHTRHRPYYN